jgi:hypothetical protein
MPANWRANPRAFVRICETSGSACLAARRFARQKLLAILFGSLCRTGRNREPDSGDISN